MPALDICSLDELPIGLGRAYEVGSKRIALFRSRETDAVYAVDSVCPHKQGPLEDGMLIGSQVVCPLHNWRFEGTSGECDQANGCNIGAYPVEVKDGRVIVSGVV
ncbi:MAG: nitrite reductase small subunit NirD [Fimbriiglobus sp.]